MTTKHIAMWACPRSRSTAITRAFERIDDCIIYDEPLYACWFVNTFSQSAPSNSKTNDFLPSVQTNLLNDTNYSRVIEKLTGSLPEGKSFSFQKQMSYHLLPEFDISWLSKVTNFFLIRNPKETVFSYWKAKTATGYDWEEWESHLGWEEHYRLFKKIEDLTQEKPLVIDSGDLVKNPEKYLKALCPKLGINFSEKMLCWEPKKTKVLCWENTPFEKFSENVINSTSFFDRSKEENIPDILVTCINKCMPFSD
ncbi:MAG: hypothetical protein AAF915_23545 [Cyanobacteria bacterium P01_D01_bin.50]